MSGNMEKVLRLMAEKSASDVYMSANTPILIKINGQILQLSDRILSPPQTRQLLAELLTPQQLEELDETGELNVGIGVARVGSFRLSAFKQRGSIAAVFRCIPQDIPSLDSLGVPAMLSQLVVEKRGLILMVGATGTGKSTTLASMILARPAEERQTHRPKKPPPAPTAARPFLKSTWLTSPSTSRKVPAPPALAWG